MKSQLKVHIDNSSLYTIGFRDESDYNLEIEIQEPLLVVKAPNFSAKSIEFTPYTWNTVNSKNLEIAQCDSFEVLPDGIYYYKYSNVPHERIFVEGHFMRTAILRSLYQKKLLDVSTQISLVSVTDNPLVKQLQEISFHIDAAEANVNECCYNTNIAIQHYKKAQSLLAAFKSYDHVSTCQV